MRVAIIPQKLKGIFGLTHSHLKSSSKYPKAARTLFLRSIALLLHFANIAYYVHSANFAPNYINHQTRVPRLSTFCFCRPQYYKYCVTAITNKTRAWEQKSHHPLQRNKRCTETLPIPFPSAWTRSRRSRLFVSDFTPSFPGGCLQSFPKAALSPKGRIGPRTRVLWKFKNNF